MKTVKKSFRIAYDSEAFLSVFAFKHWNGLDFSGFEVEYAHCCRSTVENSL
jgi:hypothetical protein